MKRRRSGGRALWGVGAGLVALAMILGAGA